MGGLIALGSYPYNPAIHGSFYQMPQIVAHQCFLPCSYWFISPHPAQKVNGVDQAGDDRGINAAATYGSGNFTAA